MPKIGERYLINDRGFKFLARPGFEKKFKGVPLTCVKNTDDKLYVEGINKYRNHWYFHRDEYELFAAKKKTVVIVRK